MKMFLNGFILIMFLFICLSPLKAQQEQAPDFELNALLGKPVALSAYKNNQPVILFFWTTWCPFCRKELTQLNNMYQQVKKDGIELFAVNVNEKGDRVSNYVSGHKINIRILLDKDGSVASSYGVMGVPTYVLIDKSGNIISKENSLPKDSYKELIVK